MEDTTASPLIIPQPNACLNNQGQQTPFASELVIITKQQDIEQRCRIKYLEAQNAKARAKINAFAGSHAPAQCH